jgi:hypothetical protein
LDQEKGRRLYCKIEIGKAIKGTINDFYPLGEGCNRRFGK